MPLHVFFFEEMYFVGVQYHNKNLRLYFSAFEKIALRKDLSFQPIFINSDHFVRPQVLIITGY